MTTKGSLLITGGAGLLGSTLASEALRSGWDVTVTVRRSPAPPGVEAIRLDLTEVPAVAAALEEARPDVVIHTAYDKSHNDAGSATVAGTRALAEAHAGLLIFTSTDLVFSGRSGRPYREADDPDPTIDYGRAKAAAEQLVLPEGLVVRLPLLVDLDRGEQAELVRAAATREATLFTDELRCPAMVGDVAVSVLALAERRYRGVVHLGGADEIDRGTLGRLLAPHLGLDPADLDTGSTPAALAASGRPRDVRLDSSLAAELGVRPRSIVDALRA